MTQEKMDRISELTRISRERELTADEQTERAELRQEYIQEWRNGTLEALASSGIVGPGKRKKRRPR